MSHPPIITLTGNLLAERTFDFTDWAPGKTQRATAGSFQVGGKGINVSKMLARLGVPSTALGFAGGPTGDECCSWLARQGIVHRMFATASSTRTGLVVRSAGQPETTFLGPNTPPDAAACRECADFLDTCPPGAVLAFCGSFPGWESEDCTPVRAAVARWLTRGTVVADTYGPPLTWFARHPVALIKVNRDEFDAFFPEPERHLSTLERLPSALKTWPVSQWVVTDGPREVCYAGTDTPPGRQMPPPVQEVSPTGSGDVLFACLLHALLGNGLALAPAVTFALPYAAANAASPGVADFDLNKPPLGRSLRP